MRKTLIWTLLGLLAISGILCGILDHHGEGSPPEVDVHGTRFSEPRYIAVHVVDEDGAIVNAATVTVENQRTGEDNLDTTRQDGNITVSDPTVLQTDSYGNVTFIYGNLPSGYVDGDDLLVTATKNGETGSTTVEVDTTRDYVTATVTLGEAAGSSSSSSSSSRSSDESFVSRILSDPLAVGAAAVVLTGLGVLGLMWRGKQGR